MEGIITINYDSQITFFSRGAEHILGRHAGQAIGRKINDIFQLPNHQSDFDTILPAILKERKNVDVLLPDHQIASLAITGARLSRPGEQETETVLVFRDISREEAVHRLLGQFLANTAHEFRTPLSSLEASIELLLDQAPELSQSELLELHTSLHIGLIGLHTLVDNLLESANIEARRFRISPRQCDLRDVIAEALQTMQPLLSKYQQNLTVELPIDDLLIKADPRRITQVLINLISNASRYGPSNSEIEIRTQINNDWVKIEVMDRGPGITPEYRKNLFSRFVYPQTSDHISTTGAGLGLSVVEAIVTAHGGEVGVEDRSGKGSIFWFRLPVE
jgi:signal transduction histidine kinase